MANKHVEKARGHPSEGNASGDHRRPDHSQQKDEMLAGRAGEPGASVAGGNDQPPGSSPVIKHAVTT